MNYLEKAKSVTVAIGCRLAILDAFTWRICLNYPLTFLIHFQSNMGFKLNYVPNRRSLHIPNEMGNCHCAPNIDE